MITTSYFFRSSLFFIFFIYGIGKFISSNYIYSVGLLFLPLYLMLFISLAFTTNKLQIKRNSLLYPFLLLLMIFIGFLRANYYDNTLVGTPTIIVNIFFFISLFLYVQTVNIYLNKIKIISTLMQGFIFYFIINIILYFFGLSNPSLGTMFTHEFETIIPWLDTRKALPLSTGYIDTSVQSLIASFFSIYFYRDSKWSKSYQSLLKLMYLFSFFFRNLWITIRGK